MRNAIGIVIAAAVAPGLLVIAPAGAQPQSGSDCSGGHWLPLDSRMDDWVRTLAEFDDGSGAGPALYAGGGFTTAGLLFAPLIAKWNGSEWSALPGGMDGSGLHAMQVFDDGSGPALYVAGVFRTAGGLPAKNIAKWDGKAWSALDSGVGAPVYALAVFDDGSGPALYAGGRFFSAGGVLANHIARWDGASWSPVGSGFDRRVRALAVFDDGGGPALYAGGESTPAQGGLIAKWNGAEWTPLDKLNGDVYSLTTFDDGSGEALYAGGSFLSPSPRHIARWDGAEWSPLASGRDSRVRALTAFDDGSGCGPALYAGGDETFPAGSVARWDGSSWSELGSVMDGRVYALAPFDAGGGAGIELYAGGAFTSIGGFEVNRVARWNPPLECYADCDASGSVEFSDFLCWQSLFSAGDPRADCDASGGLDFFDFLCFQNEFAAGCE